MEIEKKQAARKEWEDRLGEWPELRPEFIAELQSLRGSMVKRLTPNTPIEYQRHLYEGLELRVIYDDVNKQVTVSGLVDTRVVRLPSCYRTHKANAPGVCVTSGNEGDCGENCSLYHTHKAGRQSESGDETGSTLSDTPRSGIIRCTSVKRWGRRG